jgi:hypothetical protein
MSNLQMLATRQETSVPVLYRVEKSGMVGRDRADQVVFGLTLKPTEYGNFDAIKQEFQDACEDAEICLMDDLVEGRLYYIRYKEVDDSVDTDFQLYVHRYEGDPLEYFKPELQTLRKLLKEGEQHDRSI